MKKQALRLVNTYAAANGRMHKTLRMLFMAVLLCTAWQSKAAITITPASGGSAICEDKAADGINPAYTVLGPIVFTEGAFGDFRGGAGAAVLRDTIVIEAPPMWQFNTGAMPAITYAMPQNIVAVSIASFTASTLTIYVDVNRFNKIDILTISGLQVQATNTYSATGNIYMSYTAGLTGVTTGMFGDNLGTLALTPAPGAITGGLNVCPGSTTTLGNSIGGGTWSITPTTIATIDAFGVVTGVADDTATVTYTIPTGCFVTAPIAVNTLPAITGPSSVCAGDFIFLNNAIPTGTWSNRPGTGSAPVGFFGDVYGGTVGTDTIVYTLGCSVSMAVTVNPLPAPITGPTIACIGYATTLANTTPGGTWESTIPVAAYADPTSGAVIGYLPGGILIKYTITATGCYSAYFMSVVLPPSPITGPANICEASSGYMSAGTGGIWSSTNTAIATVDPSTGYTTGMSGGSVFIRYTVAGCPPESHTLMIDSLPDPILGSTSLCIGVAGMLYDSTLGGTWTSSDTTIAHISTTGVLTGMSYVIGSSATITYTLPTGCLVTEDVFINAPPAGITGDDSVCHGAMVTLANMTPGGTWSSTDLAVAAVIDTSGVVTGVTPGSVNISYTLTNGCYAAMAFRVKPNIPAIVTINDTSSMIGCDGTPLQVTCSDINAGIPSFTWRLFGTDVAIGDTFTFTPIHGDVVTVMMVTSGVCAVADTVYDTLNMTVYPNVAPVVTIHKSSYPDSVDYIGQMFSFFSDVTFGGPSPTYQWYKNNRLIAGATLSYYSTPVYQNDTFHCVVNSNSPCTSFNTDQSNKIIVYANFLEANTLTLDNGTLSLFPNPNAGSFTLSGKTNSSSLSYTIHDMLGREITTGSIVPQNNLIKERISLSSDLAAGTYVLRVNSDAGNQVFHFVVGK